MSKTSQQEMTGRPENTKGVSRRGFMIGATSAGFTLAFVPSALLTAAPAQAMAQKLSSRLFGMPLHLMVRFR